MSTHAWRTRWVLESRNPPKWRRGIIGTPRECGIAALQAATADLGIHESPAGSNLQKYGRHWGENGVAWCGLAVAYWWQRGLFPITKAIALQIDYVPRLLEMAREGKHFRRVTRFGVRKGDAVCFEFNGDGVADHVGLFSHWIKRYRTFATIEGNTGIGNDANGGTVMRRERTINQVAGFVRPRMKAAT